MIALAQPSGTPELTLVPRTRPCSRCGGPRQEGRKDPYCPPCRRAYRAEHIGASRAYNRRSEARRHGRAIPRHMYRDCLDCGEPLPLGTRYRRCWDCRQAHLRQQRRAHADQWAARNPEKVRESRRKHYHVHREGIMARQREWRTRNREHYLKTLREWRERRAGRPLKPVHRVVDGRKVCPVCEVEKAVSEFHTWKGKVYSYCKPCWRAYQNRRNRERRAAQSST